MKYNMAVRTDGPKLRDGIHLVVLAAALRDRTNVVHVNDALGDCAVHGAKVEAAHGTDLSVILDASPPSSGGDLEHPKGLCSTLHGFSLHAATSARADDAVGREALCKYILRPPTAQVNIRLGSDDLVRRQLRRPFSDGTSALDLDPWSLLVRHRRRCRLRVFIRSGTRGCCRPPVNGGLVPSHRRSRRPTPTIRTAA